MNSSYKHKIKIEFKESLRKNKILFILVAGNIYSSFTIYFHGHVFKSKNWEIKDFFREYFFKDFIITLYKLHWKTFQISVWAPIVHNIELSVKNATLIWFAQVWVVLDNDTNQIYKGCQYGLTPLNSTEDKFNWTFEEKIVDYGYELFHKRLFSIKNWEVRY